MLKGEKMTPDVSIKNVTLHISNSSVEFPAMFGAKVKAAGGRFSDIRGNRASHRYVTLPIAERDLIDRIMERFATGKKKTMVVDELDAQMDYGRRREILNHHMAVFYWDKESGQTASAFLVRAFREKLESLDWSTHIERWTRMDRAQAEHKRAFELGNRIADLRERIAAEAVRIAEGANDIDPLKELAAEYAEVCAEAGVAIKRDTDGAPAPGASPKP
jgi:predicted RNA-binding protein with PIN domain